MFKFKVIDKNTNEVPNISKIVQEEDWAKNLIWCDIDGFFLTEDGQLVLADNTGSIAIAPDGRFVVEIGADYAFPQKDKYGLTLYTDRVDGFQIRSVNYLGAENVEDDGTRFDVVKWESHDPMKVYSVNEEKEIVTTEHCYSVAFIEWDDKEDCYDIKSVGMRLIDSHPTEAVMDMILKFVNEQRKKMLRKRRSAQ